MELGRRARCRQRLDAGRAEVDAQEPPGSRSPGPTISGPRPATRRRRPPAPPSIPSAWCAQTLRSDRDRDRLGGHRLRSSRPRACSARARSSPASPTTRAWRRCRCSPGATCSRRSWPGCWWWRPRAGGCRCGRSTRRDMAVLLALGVLFVGNAGAYTAALETVPGRPRLHHHLPLSGAGGGLAIRYVRRLEGRTGVGRAGRVDGRRRARRRRHPGGRRHPGHGPGAGVPVPGVSTPCGSCSRRACAGSGHRSRSSPSSPSRRPVRRTRAHPPMAPTRSPRAPSCPRSPRSRAARPRGARGRRPRAGSRPRRGVARAHRLRGLLGVRRPRRSWAARRRIGAARAALVSTVEPVYTIVLATHPPGREPGPVQVLGGGLVVAGRAPRRVRAARAVGGHRLDRRWTGHLATPSALGCDGQEARGDRCDSPRSSRPMDRAPRRPRSRWSARTAGCCPPADLGTGVPDTIEALLAGGDAALAALRTAIAAVSPDAPTLDPTSVRVIAPLPRPGKVIAVGLNYFDHAKEGGVEPPAEPMLFAKFTTSVVGPGSTVEWDPDLTASVDLEAELGVVIGRTARRVSEADALCVCPRLHLRQRRERPGPPEVGQAVRACQVAGHLLPHGTRHRHHRRPPDPQRLAIRVVRRASRGPGLEHLPR